MRFRRYSVSEPRKSQVSFILQSIGSRDTQGWASSFSDGAIERREREKEKERDIKRERESDGGGEGGGVGGEHAVKESFRMVGRASRRGWNGCQLVF